MINLNRALPGNFRRYHLRTQIATDTSSWASTCKCNGKCVCENSSKPLCKRTPTYAHKCVTSNHGMPDWSTWPALHSFQNTKQTHPFLKGVRRGSDISVLGVPGALPVSPSIPRAVSGRILPCHLTNRVIYEETETEWQRQDWDCGGHKGAHRQTLNTYTPYMMIHQVLLRLQFYQFYKCMTMWSVLMHVCMYILYKNIVCVCVRVDRMLAWISILSRVWLLRSRTMSRACSPEFARTLIFFKKIY